MGRSPVYFTTGSDSAAGFFRGIVFMTSAEHVCEAEMKGETNSTAGNDVTAATNLHCNVDRLHKSHLPFQKNDDAHTPLGICQKYDDNIFLRRAGSANHPCHNK